MNLYCLWILNEDGCWVPFPTQKYGAIPAYANRGDAEVEAATQSRLLGDMIAAGDERIRTVYEDGELITYDPPMVEVINDEGYWEPIWITFRDRDIACTWGQMYANFTHEPTKVGQQVMFPIVE